MLLVASVRVLATVHAGVAEGAAEHHGMTAGSRSCCCWCSRRDRPHRRRHQERDGVGIYVLPGHLAPLRGRCLLCGLLPHGRYVRSADLSQLVRSCEGALCHIICMVIVLYVRLLRPHAVGGRLRSRRCLLVFVMNGDMRDDAKRAVMSMCECGSCTASWSARKINGIKRVSGSAVCTSSGIQ